MDAIANYSSSDTDDPESEPRQDPHEGKVRQFPHVDGQFATTVFFKVPPSSELTTLLDAMDTRDSQPSTRETASPQWTPMPADELHLSLSRTVPIVDAQRHSLLAELTKAIDKLGKKRTKRLRQGPPVPLDIRIGPQSMLLTNDDASRTFLALTAHDPTTTLHDIVDATTTVFTRHGLPGYYPEKKMHVSIAWCLGDHRHGAPRPPFRLAAWTVPVDTVTCRIGKKDFDIPLI